MNASKLLYISHDIHEHQITEQDLYMVIFYKIENEKKRKIYIYILMPLASSRLGHTKVEICILGLVEQS